MKCKEKSNLKKKDKRPSKVIAVLLSVGLAFWTWLYTREYYKFLMAWMILLVDIYAFNATGISPIAIWIYSFYDQLTKPEGYYRD